MIRFLIRFFVPIVFAWLCIQHAVRTENYEDQESIITAIYSAACLLSLHITINRQQHENS